MHDRFLLRNILTLCFFGVPLISACNHETHHICVSGRECLPLEWRCDNVPDCPDRSADCHNVRDELICEEIRQITHNPMNGMKVVMSSVKLAEVHEMEQDCDAGYHGCKSGPCFHGSMVCDLEVGDDEPKSCPPTACPLNQIACGSSDTHMCIPRSRCCDDELYCENGEDEKNCLHHEPTLLSTPTQSRTTVSRARTPSTTVTPATSGLLQKKDFENMEHVWVKCDAGSGMGTYKCLGENLCVNMTKTCDGQRDCPQGDDELGMCKECDHMRCSYKCQANVREARCVCPPGLVMSKDRTTCVRYNACEDHSRCSHYCEPAGDKSYKCSSAVGYSLDKSGHRCMPQVDALAGELVVSTGNEVRISSLRDDAKHHSSYQIYSWLKTGESMLHLSLDVRSHHLYMAIAGHQGEYQIAKTVRGQVSPLRRGINGLGNVEYDWVNENVFFVACGRTESPTIRVCMSDFRFCSRVLRSAKSRKTLSGRVEYPMFRDLAINPLRGLMCRIEVLHQTAKIKCGNVDGTGIFVLDDHKIEEPRALVIDYIRNDLYFADSELQRLDHINIDTHQRNLITRRRIPFEMALFNGILYYTERTLYPLFSMLVFYVELSVLSPRALLLTSAVPISSLEIARVVYVFQTFDMVIFIGSVGGGKPACELIPNTLVCRPQPNFYVVPQSTSSIYQPLNFYAVPVFGLVPMIPVVFTPPIFTLPIMKVEPITAKEAAEKLRNVLNAIGDLTRSKDRDANENERKSTCRRSFHSSPPLPADFPLILTGLRPSRPCPGSKHIIIML